MAAQNHNEYDWIDIEELDEVIAMLANKISIYRKELVSNITNYGEKIMPEHNSYALTAWIWHGYGTIISSLIY